MHLPLRASFASGGLLAGRSHPLDEPPHSVRSQVQSPSILRFRSVRKPSKTQGAKRSLAGRPHMTRSMSSAHPNSRPRCPSELTSPRHHGSKTNTAPRDPALPGTPTVIPKRGKHTQKRKTQPSSTPFLVRLHWLLLNQLCHCPHHARFIGREVVACQHPTWPQLGHPQPQIKRARPGRDWVCRLGLSALKHQVP